MSERHWVCVGVTLVVSSWMEEGPANCGPCHLLAGGAEIHAKASQLQAGLPSSGQATVSKIPASADK